MAKYIGATIGPIVETISRSKKTRSAWRASYVFSYLMKNIINELKKYEKEGKINFILPYSSDEKIYNEPQKAGLFHDRLIIEVIEEFDLKNLLEIKKKVLKRFVNKAIENKYCDSDNTKYSKGDVEFLEYLNDYINFYMVEKELNEKDNIIFEISKSLDVMELQPQICLMQFEKEKDYLFDYINSKYKNNFLERDAFGEEETIRSLPKIACIDSYNKLNKDDQKEIDKILDTGLEEDDKNTYKKLKEFSQEEKYQEIELFKKHHKYYAVVRADGDGIGAIISSFKEKKDYQEFSNVLFEFARESVEEIEEYKGLPIFAGGDDLLFFAPIINSNCKEYKNIFELTTKLSDIFEEKLKDLKMEAKGTLSFGIAINYYKYPLYEALGDSAILLFEGAKNLEGKNATSISLLKGASKPINFIFNKAEKIEFQDFIKGFNLDKKEKNLVKGVIYTLENQLELLKIIQNSDVKVTNFFINNFKKDIHTDEQGINGLNREINKILKLTIYYGKKEKIEMVIKLLRFIMFLTEEGNTNE